MQHIHRRSFLASAALAAIAAGTSPPARAKDGASPAHDTAFATVSPEAVGVDPDALPRVTQFIDAEIAAGTIPGAALVATRRGKTFASHFNGTYRDALGGDKPVHAGVAHPLFSFSKGVAGTIAALYRQERRIDFDAPVADYIPAYKGGGKDGTTVRHLLTHAAGIPMEVHGPVGTEEQWQAFLQQLCAAEVQWPPGSKTAYHSLSGMFLLAEVVRSVSDRKPWPDICRERLFAPLGAGGFSFAPDPGQSPTAVAPGYFDTFEPGSFGMRDHPAAGLFGRPEDMLRLLNMIVDSGTWEGKTIIQPDAREELLTVQYGESIAAATVAGKGAAHEPWGIGWLVRGTAPKCNAGPWFGFGDDTSATLFGHAGVDMVFGVGDPARELAFVFIMTAKLKDAAESTRLRRTVSNLLQEAVQ